MELSRTYLQRQRQRIKEADLKVADLQFQVENKSKELQKVSEKTAEQKWQYEDTKRKHALLDEVIEVKQNEIAVLSKLAKSVKSDFLKDIDCKESHLTELKETLNFMKSVESNLNNSLKILKNKQEILIQLNDEEVGLRKTICGAEQELKNLLASQEIEKKKTANIVVEAKEIIQQIRDEFEYAKSFTEGIKEGIKRIRFYARRLKKNCIIDNKKFPEDMQDFKQEKFFPSKALLVKLKQYES